MVMNDEGQPCLKHLMFAHAMDIGLTERRPGCRSAHLNRRMKYGGIKDMHEDHHAVQQPSLGDT
jgi:hypothetical protein